MKIKLISFLSIITLCTNGQTTDDAIRFSENTFGTTARSLAMGGAFGALGGDFSVTGQNPAGLAIYRRGELTFSPAFNLHAISNNFEGNNTNDSRFYFNFGSAGLVFAKYKEQKSGWKGFNFAFGYNRETTYKSYEKFSGINKSNSMLNSFVEQAEGVPVSNLEDIEYAFGPGMAYNLYLMNPVTPTATTYTAAIANGGALQKEDMSIKGNSGNFLFSMSNNFNDLLMLGATFELRSLRYDYKSTYREVDISDTINSPYFGMDIKDWAFFREESTDGAAVSLKFGMIVRPTDNIRIGAAIHSPAWYNMTYEDNYNMESTFGANGDSVFTLTSPPSSTFEYRYNTPFRALGSVAFIFPAKGLISFDYEYTNQQAARFKKADEFDYNFSFENGIIKEFHAKQHTIKVGGELFISNMYLRAGGVYTTSPYTENVLPKEYDYSSISYTVGIGWRWQKSYFDIGYALTQTQQYKVPYSLADNSQPGIESKNNLHRLMFTYGIRFNR
ncbi:MAG: hypothetical protein JNK61_01015 [Bacteroidia bacterium]|nr:hypothetical protein [Bacteroidia bacterium]